MLEPRFKNTRTGTLKLKRSIQIVSKNKLEVLTF